MNLHISLYDKFKELANSYNDDEKIVDELFNLLPPNIKQANIFKDPLGDRYLYNFGKPLNITASSVGCFGGIQNHETKNLYLALKTAKKYLNFTEIKDYNKKINNINKHQDFLFEMRPLFYLRSDLKTRYESSNNSSGGKNIDWEIRGKEYNILFDVKNRIKSTINHLFYILEMVEKIKAGLAPESIPSPIAPDPADLFKSTFKKFRDRTNNKTLQGVWIATGIMEDEKKLNEYFKSLDPKKIQFAIVSGWDKDAYILVKNNSDKQILIDYFNLIETRGFVCLNYHNNK
ncbi:MAG: hypothetical protein Q7S77_01525 [Candidatus Staskawiczbacteria bacterium]|nr:hypothetical protein [Candidatus Staskawiczbacteria bacterium]